MVRVLPEVQRRTKVVVSCIFEGNELLRKYFPKYLRRYTIAISQLINARHVRTSGSTSVILRRWLLKVHSYVYILHCYISSKVLSYESTFKVLSYYNGTDEVP